MTDSLIQLPVIIGLPLLAAIISTLASYRWLPIIANIFSILQLIIVISIVNIVPQLDSVEKSRYLLGGWGAPLGIDLHIDGLAAILLLSTAVLVLILSVYSVFYFSDKAKAKQFWPLWWILVTGLNCTFLATDAFNIYVALEIIGLSSAALVALAGNRDALMAALRYALVGLFASLLYLLGIALLYRIYGTLDLVQLSMEIEKNAITWASLSLISIGLLLKTALIPLHFWLPAAHSSAPAPVSAILSALVVKASFYLLIHFWLEVLSPAVTQAALFLMGLLGSIAIIYGCIKAYQATRLKLLIAYSTVAQLGYLFLLFPLSHNSGTSLIDSESGALQAVAFFIIAHALAKAAMFLSAGNIIKTYGHDNISQLQGIVHQQPLSIFTFAIAGVSLIGLPPSGGFIAKWLLLNSAITSGQWWWVIIMLAGGLLAATYIFRVLNLAFLQGQEPILKTTTTSVNRNIGMTICGFILAVLSIVLGFNAEWIINLLNHDNTILIGAL